MATENAANIQGTLRVDRTMTNFSLQYITDNQDHISGRAASLVPVINGSDRFVTYDRGYFLRDEMEERPLGGQPVQVGYKLGDDNYSCREYALEHFIDDRQRANAESPINLDLNATRLLTSKSLIKRDRTWVQKFFRSNVWTREYTGVSGTPDSSGFQFVQFDQAGSSPIKLFDNLLDRMSNETGLMPNTVVAGVNVRAALRLNDDLVDRVKNTAVGVIQDQMMAQLLGVDNFLVPRAVYNNAAEGTANKFEFIVNPNAMWVGYIDPNPVLDSPTAIATFAWRGLHAGAANDQGGVILRGRDDRASTDWMQIRDAWDMKLVAQDLGMFFNNVVSGNR